MNCQHPQRLAEECSSPVIEIWIGHQQALVRVSLGPLTTHHRCNKSYRRKLFVEINQRIISEAKHLQLVLKRMTSQNQQQCKDHKNNLVSNFHW